MAETSDNVPVTMSPETLKSFPQRVVRIFNSLAIQFCAPSKIIIIIQKELCFHPQHKLITDTVGGRVKKNAKLLNTKLKVFTLLLSLVGKD